MRILLDENVDNRLKEFLEENLEFEVRTTFDNSLTGTKDKHIMEYCLENETVVMTHDDDFLSLASSNSHPSIIYLPQRIKFREMKNRARTLQEIKLEEKEEIYFI